MAKINVTLPLGDELFTGKLVAFQAPCRSEDTGKLVVNGVEFDVVDATENVLAGKSGFWAAGAMVTVMLRMDAYRAYLQSTSIAEVAADLADHEADGTKHVTAEEKQAINAHIADKDNPHNVTVAQIGAAPMYQYSQTDITAGTTPLAEGQMYLVYE